eukprot:scaffold316442_cov22-Tisochrysis_lutea.AAC.1
MRRSSRSIDAPYAIRQSRSISPNRKPPSLERPCDGRGNNSNTTKGRLQSNQAGCAGRTTVALAWVFGAAQSGAMPADTSTFLLSYAHLRGLARQDDPWASCTRVHLIEHHMLQLL